MSTLKEFRHQYSAELLMRADTNTAPGDLYDWVGLLHRRLDSVGLNIVDELPLDGQATTLKTQLQQAPTAATTFAQLDLTQDIHAAGNIKLPNVLQALEAELDHSKVASFAYEKVISKPMPAALRLQIRALLEKLREQQTATYRTRIRPFWVIDNLFYATEVVIKLTTGTKLTAHAEAAVQGVDGHISLSATNNTIIRYNQQNCPFAAELTRGKDL